MPRTMIGFVIFPRFTALDAIGPYEVLARVPGARAVWIAESLVPVTADRGVTLVPDETFESAPPLDVVVVPGGPGQYEQMNNEALLSYLRRTAEHATWVASACTGSLLLAQAGLLDGKRAVTHWLAMDALASMGVVAVEERVVRDGNILTAAGVSAGIDLALTLAAELTGTTTAQAIQLGIEYDPKPPFDSGSPKKAPQEVVDALRENARTFLL